MWGKLLLAWIALGASSMLYGWHGSVLESLLPIVTILWIIEKISASTKHSRIIGLEQIVATTNRERCLHEERVKLVEAMAEYQRERVKFLEWQLAHFSEERIRSAINNVLDDVDP